MDRSYGTSGGAVERRVRMFAHMLVLGLALMAVEPASAQILAQTPAAGQKPVKMVVLGDSLSAGLGLPGPAAFPARYKML
jgi:acyl-CoA thioesterase-1